MNAAIARIWAGTAARPFGGLTQTKGFVQAWTVVGPRTDLRWPRESHYIGLGFGLEQTLLTLRGILWKRHVFLCTIEMDMKFMFLSSCLFRCKWKLARFFDPSGVYFFQLQVLATWNTSYWTAGMALYNVGSHFLLHLVFIRIYTWFVKYECAGL